MEDELFSREEILSGGVSRERRARALLYLIEQEAGRMRDQRAMLSATVAMSAEAGVGIGAIIDADPEAMRKPLPGEHDAAFIESFRNARRESSSPHLKTLVSNVDSWRVLIPEDLSLRAEVLHQMSLRHSLPRNKAKAIAEAFGVGDPAFDAAYEKTVGQVVSTAFAPDTGLLASLRRRRT